MSILGCRSGSTPPSITSLSGIPTQLLSAKCIKCDSGICSTSSPLLPPARGYSGQIFRAVAQAAWIGRRTAEQGCRSTHANGCHYQGSRSTTMTKIISTFIMYCNNGVTRHLKATVAAGIDVARSDEGTGRWGGFSGEYLTMSHHRSGFNCARMRANRRKNEGKEPLALYVCCRWKACGAASVVSRNVGSFTWRRAAVTVAHKYCSRLIDT